MKTIGILGGMTWESTVTYYQVLNEYISKALGGLHSADIFMHSVDFAPIYDTQVEKDWDRAAEILSDSANKLKDAGADFIVLATNTMHVVAPQIKKATGLPLIHIAEVTVEKLKEKGITKVGLLGTKSTMEMDFYKDVLIENGITPIVPKAQQDRDEVHRVIIEELSFGELKESSREHYKKCIEEVKSEGATGVILGCTEIGLLIKQKDSVLPVFDTALIHAEEIAKFALQ